MREFDRRSATLPPGFAARRIRHERDARSQTNLEMQTSSGLTLDVLTDRALDIGAAFYKGTPIAWTSDEQFRHPLDLNHNVWNERFEGGLVATCGLDNVGPSCIDAGEQFPQHGRIGGEPAKQIRLGVWVVNGRRFLVVSAKVRQPDTELELNRTLCVCDDVPILRVVDTVVNRGVIPEPLMMQYHCNFGRPIVTLGGSVEIPEGRTTPRDAAAAERLDSWQTIDDPRSDEQERVFRHQQPMQRWASSFLSSPPIPSDSRWTICLRYDRRTLPWIWQWRLLSTGAYVIGLEPANCEIKPRSEARRQNALPTLAPKDKVTFRIEIGVGRSVRPIASQIDDCASMIGTGY